MAHTISLKIGDKAPDFKGLNQKGELISFNHYNNKKLVLFFYPKDNTPGCTAEACDLRDNYNYFLNNGYDVVGISADSEASHLKFSEKFNLPYNILSDTEKLILKAYGVWGEKSMYGKKYEGIHRTTFIINEKGIIENIITKVQTKTHSKQIIELNK